MELQTVGILAGHAGSGHVRHGNIGDFLQVKYHAMVRRRSQKGARGVTQSIRASLCLGRDPLDHLKRDGCVSGLQRGGGEDAAELFTMSGCDNGCCALDNNQLRRETAIGSPFYPPTEPLTMNDVIKKTRRS